ncbi:MAG: aconitase family protein, partial [Emergencia sp.]
MADNIVFKILKSHLTEGELIPGQQITISVDQTLGHDLTAIMAGQTLMAVNADKVATEASVFYCDHNTLCVTSENTDDHMFLKTTAQRFGAYFSKPGNGICHFLHCQRFAKPGKVMLGADSHTPTSGALGMLAIGSGGLTVAKAALGEGFKLNTPKVLGVKLTGKLQPGSSAKDIALELLRILSVKGGIGYIVEYFGDGVSTLSVSERQTIANMSIELGATTGVFPSDEVTREFLAAQEREEDYIALSAD